MGTTLDEEADAVRQYHDDEIDDSQDAPITENSHLYPPGQPYEDEDSSPPTPRFIQDEDGWRNWQWVPSPLRRTGKRVAIWAKGPDPPQIQTISPIFASIQEYPIRLLDRYVPKRRDKVYLLLAYYLCWMLTFGLVLRASTIVSEVADYGIPVNLGCGNTFFFAGNICGINGNNCRPFSGESFAFRCPADCGGYQALNPRAVGAQEIVYRPFVIGGPSEASPESEPLYRGDSVICGSAIHAGVIDDSAGGCGVVSTVGRGVNYPASKRNKISSVEFDSSFPKSFTFKKDISCEAKDLRWPLFGISAAYTLIFSLFCSSPAVYFFTVFTAVFAHTGFASDPPNHADLTDLFSNLLGKFLPASFCAFVMYSHWVRKTLTGLTAQVEKTVLWLGAVWLGALSNYTFRWIPISRLTAHDLKQQPGAKVALFGVVLFLVCVVIQQIYYFRLEGRLIRYLGLYGLFLLFIFTSLLLPGLNLRIHHYILALLLIPGTSMQTRPVLFYQGLLIGLFINGIARWGFDSILQTSAALQGDAVHNSLLPEIFEPAISLALSSSLQSIVFNWTTPPSPMDGISVLVNDVERFRGYKDDVTGEMNTFGWQRKVNDGQEEGEGALPEYFRFAYMQGSTVWDYTKAGIWGVDGGWTVMEDGPSKVRIRAIEEEGNLVLR